MGMTLGAMVLDAEAKSRQEQYIFLDAYTELVPGLEISHKCYDYADGFVVLFVSFGGCQIRYSYYWQQERADSVAAAIVASVVSFFPDVDQQLAAESLIRWYATNLAYHAFCTVSDN